MTNALTIRVDTGALTRLGKKYLRFTEEIDTLVDRSQQSLAKRAEKAYAGAARDAGYPNVAKGVYAIREGNTILIRVVARNPETGYDYSLITRIGHKVARIYPKRRSAATVLATGRKRAHGKKAMLRFPYHGRILYRGSVAAWSPTHDWADDAKTEVEAATKDEARKLEATFIRRLSS